MAKKTQTEELPNMPKPDAVGVAAQNYQVALEKLEAAQQDKGDCMTALYKALVRAKRTSITVNGYVFERFHQDRATRSRSRSRNNQSARHAVPRPVKCR